MDPSIASKDESSLIDICSSIRPIVSLGRLDGHGVPPTHRQRSSLDWFVIVKSVGQVISFASYVIRKGGAKTYRLVGQGKHVQLVRDKAPESGDVTILSRHGGNEQFFLRPWTGRPVFFTDHLLDPSSYDEKASRCTHVIGPEEMATCLGGQVLAFDASHGLLGRKGYASFKNRAQAYDRIKLLSAYNREPGMEPESSSPRGNSLTCPGVAWYEVPRGPCRFHIDVQVSRLLNPGASAEVITSECIWSTFTAFGSLYGPRELEALRWDDSDDKTISSHFVFFWVPVTGETPFVAFENNHSAMVPFALKVQQIIIGRNEGGVVRTLESEKSAPFSLDTYKEGHAWRLPGQAKPSNVQRILISAIAHRDGSKIDWEESFVGLTAKEVKRHRLIKVKRKSGGEEEEEEEWVQETEEVYEPKETRRNVGANKRQRRIRSSR